MKEKLYAAFIVVILGGSLYLSYTGITEGRESGDYDPICIHGHMYWTATFGMKGMLAIQVDDEGRPISCVVAK